MDLISVLFWAPSYSRCGQIAHSQAVCSKALLPGISFRRPTSLSGVRLRRDGRPTTAGLPRPRPRPAIADARANALRGGLRRPRGDQAGGDRHGLRHPRGAPPPQGNAPSPSSASYRRNRPVCSGSVWAPLEMFGFQAFLGC